MPIGTNIPGTTSYYLKKPKYPAGTTGPTAPYGAAQPQPAPATPPGPQQASASPMGRYVGTVAQKPVTATPTAIPGTYQPQPNPQQPAVPAAVNPQATASSPSYMPPTPPAVPSYPAPPSATMDPLAKAGQMGSTLQDPGQLTEAGRLYAQRITQNLQGNNPLVTQASQAEDTAAARRAYLSRKNTMENLAQTPFTQGSAQYQRALDESQAGVNAANQEGRNAVNAFTRQTSRDALSDANGLEDQQYGRAVGERTYRTSQNQDLSASIQDPKAKYAYQRMVAQGVDPKDAYAAVVGQSGTINEQYRGQSPVATVQQDATDWVKATTDLQEGTPEFQKAVRARMTDLDAATNQPVNEAKNTAEQADIEKAIRAGEKLTPEQEASAVKNGTIPEFTAANLGGYKDQKVADLIGKPINIGGKVYTVVRGSRTRTGAGTFTNQERHTDWTEIKDSSGKSYYVYNGKINEKPPKEVSNDISPFGF